MSPVQQTPVSNESHRRYQLRSDVTFLNHGSFGACPESVLEAQAHWRSRLEAQPVDFLVRQLPGELARVRQSLGDFLRARGEDLALVVNATAGVNTVLRSWKFEPGDEILCTSHGYNACNNAARRHGESQGAQWVLAELPFPVRSADELTAAVLARCTKNTRFALIDHITSPTALRLPVEELVPALQERGIVVLDRV